MQAANAMMLPLLLAGMLACQPAAAMQDSYLGRIKDAEARLGGPEVFARIEAMTFEEQLAFARSHRRQFDVLRNVRSLAGDATGAARAALWFEITDPVPAHKLTAKPGELDALVAEDALQAIVREAKKRQIVILNEAHHVPLHRVFAARLASELRKIGYEYLAAETFATDVPAHPATPMQVGGYYVREPMYAGFVRGALREGWTFVGYDHWAEGATPAERIRQREVGAARNIVAKTFARNPQAKVFMYVGYGHGQKHQWSDGRKSVALLVKETTGIDPLSIDQSAMYGRGDARIDLPQYRAAMARFAPTTAIVLKNAAGGHAVQGGLPGYDMQVFHPDETAHGAHGRPLWMERRAGLRPLPVPVDLLPATGRRLVQAFHVADGRGAIPADQVMVEAGKPAPSFMLPEGQFRFGFEE